VYSISYLPEICVFKRVLNCVCVWFVILFLSGDQIGHDENSGLTFKHWVSGSANCKHLSRIEIPVQTHAKSTVT
jgi:hypothetical protein